MYADWLLRHFVRTNVEDVLYHGVVNGLSVEGLVIALHQDFVALFKCKQQDLHLKGQTSNNWPQLLPILRERPGRGGVIVRTPLFDGQIACKLTSEEHQSWNIERMWRSWIWREKAASHSGSTAMCWPNWCFTSSIPLRQRRKKIRIN